jgi:hypothetical protein
LRQSFRDFELVVVDDGSTDGTADVLAAIDDPRLNLIRLPRNGGGNAARNRGIEAANSALISFLDSDDEYLPDRLEGVVRYFGEHPDVDLLVDACIKRWPDQPGKRDRVRSNPVLEGNSQLLSALFDRRLFKATPGITVRRDIALRAGLFDEGLRRRQDYDFILRVARIGRLASRNTPSWIKVSSADAITADLDRALEAITALWDRHPEYFGRLDARTGMADDLARHFAKLVARREARLLVRDARAVFARFGTVPVVAMTFRGFGTYLSRKARHAIGRRPAIAETRSNGGEAD